jgi:hypothetical protein
MINNHRTARDLSRWGIGTGLVGSVAAAAAMIGVAVAHADSTNVLDTAATTASSIDSGAILSQLGDIANLAQDSITQALDYFQHTSQAATTPADLLATVSTNLTDANNVLSGAPGAEGFLVMQEGWLNELGPLQAAENAISSHDGFLSNLVDQLFLDPIDQNLVRASDALIPVDQALVAATTSGVNAADLDVGLADFQMGLALLDSTPILYAADFLTLLP